MINVNWYQAAEYCNWLSQQEGLPQSEWCYVPNGEGKYEVGMRLAAGYLRKRGYRLPAEAEWEYACRTSTLTRRHYGDADELLGEYAWYSTTTSDDGVRPGGLLKPNDLGLFDMYGNAVEWVQEPAVVYRWQVASKDKEDVECDLPVRDTLSRLLRGGAFVNHASLVRSAYRYSNRPSIGNIGAGFRVARTYP
jgi:formylglycine-generating enzyme required for sulfatase activity